MSEYGSVLGVVDGHLVFDGVDVVALAQRVPTPFFLFSGRQVRWNVEVLRNAFSRKHLDTELFYASKACSNMWFLKQVLHAGSNAEVNSGGELQRAVWAGFRPDQIVFNGVAKTEDEIRLAVSTGVRAIIADSLYELERIAEVASGMDRVATVALRVDVDVAADTHPGMVTAHGGKAGIDRDDAVTGFEFAAAHAALDARGLHMHIGSQVVETAPYVRAVETAIDLIEQAEAATDGRLEFLDAGGGFAIPYKRPRAGEEPATLFHSMPEADAYAAAVCDTLRARRPDLRLFIEPGRSVAANAAILVARVQNAKTKRVRDAGGAVLGEEHWLTVDAGYNTLLEHCLYDWYYPAVAAGRAAEPATERYRLAGPLCDGGDVFVGDDGTPWRHFPAGTGVGDLIAFANAGTYTLEMMQPCNAQPRAAAFAVDHGKLIEIRRRETDAGTIALDLGWR